MSIASQLYELQGVDLEVEANKRELAQMTSQLGESESVKRLKDGLALEQGRLEELRHSQHKMEGEVDDISVKIAAVEEELFSGRLSNPKELGGMQHEVDSLKSRRAKREDGLLEVMEQVEQAMGMVAGQSAELEKVEVEWRSQQQRLAIDVEKMRAALAGLEQRRQVLCAGIDDHAIDLYQRLRKTKGEVVAKVEQGRCRGCRIALPTTELQRACGGNPVQCGSCGRILFLA